MIPSLTLNALSSGLGHFGVALDRNHIRHIDTYGAVVDNSKTKISCFVRSSVTSTYAEPKGLLIVKKVS